MKDYTVLFYNGDALLGIHQFEAESEEDAFDQMYGDARQTTIRFRDYFTYQVIFKDKITHAIVTETALYERERALDYLQGSISNDVDAK